MVFLLEREWAGRKGVRIKMMDKLLPHDLCPV